ncbi:MAG: urease accessory protein UreF [Burkholderiaceae bacterium]
MRTTGAGGTRRLLAMLQLASPGLPVGGFAYSQGLEKAIEDAIVHDAASARRWIEDLLTLSLARFEAPLWLRAWDACKTGDHDAFARWNEECIAARETAELRAETMQMGVSLVRVMPALGIAPPTCAPIAFPTAFAAACAALDIGREDGLAAYLWAWVENQVLVAVKSVPLGQMAGQRLLVALHPAIDSAMRAAVDCPDDALGSATVQYAINSARHEAMYSRLYRS